MYTVQCTINTAYDSLSWKVTILTINVNHTAVARFSGVIELHGEKGDRLTRNHFVVISSKNLNKTCVLKNCYF